MPQIALPAEERDTEDLEPPAPASEALDHWLVTIIGLVVLVFVTAGLSLTLYVSSMRDAPRTAVERSVVIDRTAVREHPGDVENYARLALSYADAERWDDAEQAIQRGRGIQQAAILDLTEADILRLQHAPAAVVAYDKAIRSGEAEYRQAVDRLKEEKGVSVPPPDKLTFEAHFGKALSLQQLGRTSEALAEARKAAAIDSTAADLHAAMGEMLLKLRRNPEARVEFQQALRYDPTLKEALDGFAKTGKP